MKVVTSNEMPRPSEGDVLSPIAWLFDARARLYDKSASAANINTAKSHFVRFVNAQYGSVHHAEILEAVFNEFTHVRFTAYVNDLKVSSMHSNGIISACRVVLTYALELKVFPWVKSFAWGALNETSRETDYRTPYSENELAQINDAIDDSILFAQGLLSPYVRKCEGKSYRQARNYGMASSEENMLIYFENQMGCKPVTLTSEGAECHRGFMQAATNRYGGLHNLYRKWGVSAHVDQWVILPFYLKLLMITGMNTESVASLNVDSYVESHPLTNQPYIEYFKARSSGDKELHTGLLNRDVTRLTGKQSQEVKHLWDAVLRLTESIRAEAPDDIKNKLFLWQSRSTKRQGDITSLESHNSVMIFCKAFVKRYELKSDDGLQLAMRPSRFRPALVSKLVKEGVDMDVIQSILGHQSVTTTLGYLDSHDFAPKARREIKKSVESIFQNNKEMQRNPQPIATDKNQQGVFQTTTALCKNVFNPPEHLKKGMDLQEGQACTNFNMCLRCSNVIIMREHLPRLAALKRSYEMALTTGVERSTHVHAVRQSLSVLDNIFDPEKSEFSDDDINWALTHPEDEGMIDPIAYRAVSS